MSYYILPKNNNILEIIPLIDVQNIPIYTSYSIYHHYYDANEQLLKISSSINHELSDVSFNEIETLYKEFNPYEYIFSKVPGSKYSVSKIKTKTNLFYEFLEISTTLNCFDSFKNTNIKYIHYGENFSDVSECFTLLRENKDDSLIHYQPTMLIEERSDFLFFEMENKNSTSINESILSFLKIIMKILKHQSMNGICMIQITHMIHKPILQLLFLLSSLFEKSYIIKPNSSNIIYFDKYIVCKHFIMNEYKIDIYKKYYHKLNEIVQQFQEEKEKNILSVIHQEIPYYFLNKIDDINIIIGQQQLECIDQITNVFKNNNKKERIEYIRKTNIQKSVHWCEKFKIPCNKFLEKTNIFLPIVFKKEYLGDNEQEEMIEDTMEESTRE
jgi:hypothetical protein